MPRLGGETSDLASSALGVLLRKYTALREASPGRTPGHAVPTEHRVMTIQLTPPSSTPDHPSADPDRAGRVTRALSAHPRRSLLAVFLFVLVAGFFGGPVAGSLESSGGFAAEDADSVQAIERLEAASGQAPGAGLVLLVDTPDGLPADAARVAEVTDQLAAEPDVAEVTSPTTTRGSPEGAGLVSADGTQVLVLGTLTASADDEAVAESVLDTFDGQDDVAVGGGAVVGFQLGSTIGEDLARAELFAFPLLIVLSLIFFRGRAALMPLVVGVTTVLGTFLVLTGINAYYGLSVFALNLVIGLGLGLAIDYTLFLVTRYREELEAQGPTLGAIATTMRTAGRTVAFSATTVAVALIALTAFPLGFIKSMGIAGAVVAVVAATAALVVSPAVFALWGAKLGRKRPAAAEDSGRWYRLAHGVMRRPGAIAIATGVVMLALAAPALRAEWTPVDSSVIPTDKSSRTVADAVAADFGGTGGSPMTVAITTADPGGDADVAAYADRVNALPGVIAPGVPVQLDATTWQLDVTAEGEPDGPVAQTLVEDARAIDTGAGIDPLVSGPAADFVDQQSAIGSRLPLAVGLLVMLTLLVLWLMTGSVVLPLKAVRHERPDRGRVPGCPHLHLPGRPPDRAAELHAQRRDRAHGLPRHRHVDLRAVDGLRRVPAGPDQGDPRQRAGRAGVGRRRRPADRGRGHRGRHPARRRDRLLQHQLDQLHPADRHRHRVRRPHRRLRGEVAAGAVPDGSARQVQLVGADAAAPPARPDRAVRAVTSPSTAAYRPRVRLHPRTVGFDLFLVLALAATMLVELWQSEKPDTLITPLSVGVVVLAALPVLLRRTRPILALVLAIATLYVVMGTVDIYQTVPFPSMVAGYSIALARDRRTTIITGLALVPPVIAAIALFGHDDVLFRTAEIPKNLAFVAAPLLIGSAVRERRAAHDALVERAETAERTREEEALRRVGEERLRIARDVHDVVAHAMVAINVQAGVGAHLLDRDPERARRTLQDIKKLSGEALDDLRATLGALRTDEDEVAPVRPAQGLRDLGDLGDLGESLRSAGVEVEVDIAPATRTLPASVTTAGYRIVQEALTNVVRHASGSRAHVRVAREGDQVVIEVRDDGRGVVPAGATSAPGTGSGVRGMRERALAAGGTLEAGPLDDGGWRVLATLPVGAT